MTLRARRVLFYGLFALFFIVGTAIVLYAQGWRLDLATFKTEKVGAIFVESFPSNASITLDGKAVRNTTGFLSRGTLISDLFPRSYTLSLAAPGYDAWTEHVSVEPTLVTEMKYAVLVPANASSASPAAQVADFFEATGGGVVTQSAGGTIATPRPTAGGGLTATSSLVIAHGALAGHSADFSTALVRTPSGAYLAYDLAPAGAGTQATSTTDISALLAAKGVTAKSITAIAVNPFNGANVLVETPSHFYTIDLSAGTVATLATAPSGRTLEAPLAISSSWLAWAQYDAAADTSHVIVYDPFSDNTIDATLSVPGRIASLQWIRSTVLGVLGTDGELYRYDVPSETATKMADSVKAFTTTADGSTVAALEAKSIEIFSLTIPASQGGYYRFNLPNMASVRSLIWYGDGTHLFVVYPDRVKFLDLADLSLANLTTVSSIATGTMPQYDPQQNALYLIDQGGKLLRFEFPN